MTVQEIDLGEAMSRQGPAPVANGRDEGGGAQADRAGKAQMMLGHANIEGRPDNDVAGLLGLMGDDFRAEPVRAQQAGGPVLLIGADGNDHGLGPLEEILDLGPGGQVQQHGGLQSGR